MAESVGQTLLRAENVSRVVKGFAQQKMRMLQLCQVDSSSSWIESYYREASTILTGGTGSAIRGIPRLASFPEVTPTWTKVQAFIEKYGAQHTISIEDVMTDNIPVLSRALERVGEAIANAIDIQIEAVMNTDAGNAVAITAGNEWNSATIANRDPIQNILDAQREIFIDNYDALENGFLVLSPTDYANLMGNAKFLSHPTFKSVSAVENGKVSQVLGLTIIVSNVVTADQAYVVIAKKALTWKETAPLTIITKQEEGVSYTVRGWAFGVAQMTDTNAVCEITNTQA